MDQTINVNITPGQFRPSLHYSQGDVGRVFKIQVVDFDIPSGSTVQCVATKPSGLGFTLAGTVSGNEITFVTTDAVTDEWGRFPAEVKIINGGNVIGTANFLMIGEKNPHPDSTIDGKQEEFIPLLTLLVERIEAAAEDVDAQVPVVQQAADDAAASAAAASDSADSASDSATSASGSANEASNSAIDAAASASSAATSAEDAKESAEAFVGENYVEDTRPYLFHQTGDGAQGVGTRERLKSIIGATVAWNQLVAAGEIHKSGTASADGWVSTSGEQMSLINGHKYLCSRSGKYTKSANGTRIVSTSPSPAVISPSARADNYEAIIWSCTESRGTYYLQAYTFANEQYDFYLNVIDLTALFSNDPTIADYIYQLEQSTAGAGVALFRKYFGDSYYPYDAGSLKSVEGLESHETVGFNAWDEEWKLGAISGVDGSDVSRADRVRSKNFIPVLPSTTYYAKAPILLSLYFYDASKAYIAGSLIGANNTTFVTPANAYYAKIVYADTTYNHDICINISDPAKNGQYEPYAKHSYPLDSSLTLRGLLKLANGKLYADGDEYKADGSVNRRYGVVNLGSLTWTKGNRNTDNTANIFYVANSTVKAGACVCPRFVYKHASPWENMKLDTIDVPTGYIVVAADYTDAAAFKTAMSGVYLVYELATPTTESADPYTELQICDPLGTEEFVTDGIVPVGNVTQYPEDLKAKLEGLPWNFSTLIAPTEATSTASRAYAIGDYLILNNVLYKVTAAIASGGTITVGTNVKATTVTDEIKALRS